MNDQPAMLLFAHVAPAAIMDQSLSKLALRVLIALSTHARPGQYTVRPAQGRIGSMLGVSRQRVQKGIKELLAAGYLLEMSRGKCWKYALINPPHATTGGASNKQPLGVHDKATTGGAQTTREESSPLTPLTQADGEESRCAHSRGPDGPLSAPVILSAGPSAPAPSLSAGRSARDAGREFPAIRGRSPQLDLARNPIQIACEHLSRHEAGQLIAMAQQMGQEKALLRFNFDKHGRKLANVAAQ